MVRLLVVVTLVLVPALGWSAAADDRTGSPAIQHGQQPNPGEVRPGSPQGNAPSETAGALVRQEQARRVLGLPVAAALTIGAVLIVLLVAAGIAIPRARRRARARGGGSYDGA
jgi:hypothetical protein